MVQFVDLINKKILLDIIIINCVTFNLFRVVNLPCC